MKRICCLGLLLLSPAVAPAQEPKFIRVREADGKVTALEVAITRYTNTDKTLTVDLVGVVHIGDRAYYDTLNKRFPKYDAVLYELVGPPGAKVPKGGKKDSPLAMLNTLMTTVLDLDSQLTCVDYGPKNFVHADLSFETMMEAAKERGDDGVTLALSVTADLLRQQNLAKRKKDVPADEPDLAEALLNPALLKRELARQLAGSADLGRTLQTLLVADRNKKACQVLTQQIVAGKKNLAIFYGAAHMPDFDRRLRDEFGLRRQGQEWLAAWDLRERADDPTRRLLKLLEKVIDD